MWENSAGPGARPLILAKSRSPYYEEIKVIPIQATKKPWYYDLQRYLETEEFPEDAEKKERMSLRMLSRQFISFQGMLYKRMPTGVHLRCVDKNEAQKLIEIVYEGVCRVHMNGMVLAKKIA